jgi:hypothetical protein
MALMCVVLNFRSKTGRPQLKARYWSVPANRRRFFLSLAAAMNFNPLDVNKWKQITLRDIIAHKVTLKKKKPMASTFRALCMI